MADVPARSPDVSEPLFLPPPSDTLEGMGSRAHSLRRHIVGFLRLPVVRSVSSFALSACVTATVGGKARGGEPFTVMQVGGRGGADPYTHWLRLRGEAKTVGVEPEAVGLDDMRAKKAYDYVVDQALSDTEGDATLYVTRGRGWCSLLQPDETAIAAIATERCLRERSFEVVGTQQVRCTTFDRVRGSLPPIDYLQIDVQGAELRVLRGAEASLEGISMVELETRFSPVYRDESLFPETHAFLESHGFRLHRMWPQGEREFGRNYVEVNACYYNAKSAAADPAHMDALMRYADAKHAQYGNSLLRLLCDVHPVDRLSSEAVKMG